MDQKRAYGYIRVSTKQQAGEDRMGIEAQKQSITEYADRNGYNIVKWYVDEISGVKEDRPKLNEILYSDLPVQDKIEAVIAYKSDRIARDIKLYFYYLFVLERKRIKLLSVSEQFGDDENGLATVFRALMLFVAEQERKNISMRTRAGRKVKSGQGGYSGGRVPYGYTVVDHRLEINKEEADMVCSVFSMREAGSTMHEIAETLNQRGYRTRRGGLFCTSNIQSILGNQKTYEGYYKYGDSGWVQGEHDPIFRIDNGLVVSTTPYDYVEPKNDIIEPDEPNQTDLDEIEPDETTLSDLDIQDDAEPVSEETIPEEPEPTIPDLVKPIDTAIPRPVTFVGGVFHA